MANGLNLGADTYRAGAFERLSDATELLAAKRYVACIYLAGRAVEGMFRALVCLKTREFDTGHDLRRLLKRAGSLGVLSDPDRDRLNEDLDRVAIAWQNQLRFAGEDQVRRWFKQLRLDRKTKGDVLKTNTRPFLNACSNIVNRGELAWIRYKKPSKKR